MDLSSCSNGERKTLTSLSKAAQRVSGSQIRYIGALRHLTWSTDYLQTVSNACASVALLNIVNNIPNIELGEHLQQFKIFTSGMTPALRGDAISNFSFVKEIHNTYARSVP